MLGIKNKIAKKLAGFVAPYLTPETPEKSVVLEADVTHGRQVINKANCAPMSQEALLTSQEAAKLLKLSFQRTAAEFMVSQEGKPSYALDSVEDCKLSVKNMFGMDGVANAVIYTFFAKHGFIGWQLCSMLSQHWLINRACRLPNEDALAPGWKLDWQNGNGAEEESEEKEKKAELLKECVEVANKKFNLAEKALRFGINRSIYGQALAYFIIEGEDPSTPLNIDGIKPGSFKGINVVEPYWAFPDWKIDSMNPGSLSFYRPEFYTIGGQRIHRSRLVVKPFVEVPDVLKPSYYFGGIPLTQMIYERVYAAEKTANEVPELALTKRMLVVDANMADFVANPDVMAAKMNLLAKFRNNNGVFFKDRPDQVTQVDTNLSDLDANVWTQYQLVASVSSLPADRLLCTSPKGFQSTGEYEQRTYAQTLKSAYQEFAFREFLEKAHAIVMKSELGVSDPFVLNFNPIDTPTEAEKAQTLLTKASRDAALVNAGIISPEEARGALIADKESGYGDISAEAPEMGDLAQLQGLLGPEQGQEPQPGQDKATDSATVDFDPNQKRDKSGQWTAEGGSETSSTEEEKNHFQNPKKSIGTAEIEGKKLNVYYQADKDTFLDKLEKTGPTKIEPIKDRKEVIKLLRPLAGNDLKNDETQITAQVNSDQRGKLPSGAVHKSVLNGFSMEDHFGAAAKIDELYKKAILRFEREDESGDHNVLSIRRFIAPIIVNNKPAYAKLTVKETHTNNENHKNIYTVELHSLEQVTEGGAGLDSLT